MEEIGAGEVAQEEAEATVKDREMTFQITLMDSGQTEPSFLMKTFGILKEVAEAQGLKGNRQTEGQFNRKLRMKDRISPNFQIEAATDAQREDLMQVEETMSTRVGCQIKILKPVTPTEGNLEIELNIQIFVQTLISKARYLN